MIPAIIKAGLTGLVIFEGTEQVIERSERNRVFQQARDYANSTGKPLLVVGSPKSNPFAAHHPCGDVTIDIDPELNSYCDFQIADVRAIPYPSYTFGAAYISHVLEHLSTIDDAFQALDELYRVADHVFVVSPHKASLIAWIHPEHNLWITPSDDGYTIEQRGNRFKTEEKAYTISLLTIAF